MCRLFAGCVCFLVFSIVSAAWASEDSERQAALGMVDYHARRYEAALVHFETAIANDPGDANAHHWRGTALAALEKWREAASAFGHAAGLDSTMGVASLDAGYALVQAGEDLGAIPHLERALLSPSVASRARILLAATMLRLDREAGARPLIEQAIAAHDEYSDIAQIYSSAVDAREGRSASTIATLRQAERGVTGTTLGNEAAALLEATSDVTSRRRWDAWGGLAFEYDTNPELVPSIGLQVAQEIFGDGDIFKEEADFRAVVHAGALYTVLRAENAAVDVSYSGSQSFHFERGDNDLGDHQLALDGAVIEGDLEYGLSGSYDFYLRDHDSLLQQGILRPWIAYNLSDWTRAELFYEGRLRHYERREFRTLDGLNHAGGIRWDLAPFGPSALVTMGYRYDREDVGNGEKRPFAYHGHEFELRGAKLWGEHTLLDAGYRYRDEHYDNSIRLKPAGMGRERADREHTFEVSARRRLQDHVWLVIGYAGQWNHSTVPLFEYERHILTLGAEVRR